MPEIEDQKFYQPGFHFPNSNNNLLDIQYTFYSTRTEISIYFSSDERNLFLLHDIPFNRQTHMKV